MAYEVRKNTVPSIKTRWVKGCYIKPLRLLTLSVFLFGRVYRIEARRVDEDE